MSSVELEVQRGMIISELGDRWRMSSSKLEVWQRLSMDELEVRWELSSSELKDLRWLFVVRVTAVSVYGEVREEYGSICQ